MRTNSLTAIIPLRYTLEELDQLNATITNCRRSSVRVILVIDKHHNDFSNPVVDEWLRKHSSHLEILEGNYSGPGSARNAGLAKFRENPSRWLAFWDADDSPFVGEIASLIEAPALAEKTMIIGNFMISNTIDSSEKKSTFRTKNLQQLGIQGGLWRVIFNFQSINHFPEFPNLRMGEDQVFLSRLVFDEREVEFIDSNIYIYRKHSENQLINSAVANSEVNQALEVMSRDIQIGNSGNSIREIFFANLAFSTFLKRNWDRNTAKSISLVLMHKPSVMITMIRIFWIKLTNKFARKKSTYVLLTGGLGNQLFQLASALKSSCGPVIGVTSLGSQYRGEEIDIEKYDFPFSNVVFHRLERNRLLIKSFNLGIRLSIRKTWLEKLSATRFLIRVFLTLFFTVYFKQRVVINISDGVSGLFASFENQTSVSIGYFQNIENFSDSSSRKFLENCQLRDQSDLQTLAEFEARAILRKPCIIHVRLGDYLSSTDFHNLDPAYYAAALQSLFSESDFSEIWLFSDEPVRAQEFVPVEFQNKIYIPEIPIENSTLTLEVMKLGTSYVIANSTFSWWAAFLRKNQTAKVIAPSMWFKNDSMCRPAYPKDWAKL